MSTSADQRPPDPRPAVDGVPAGVHERRWRILGVLCLSLVLIVAANSSLNVALPTLVRELDATQTQLQWIVDAYAIVFAGLLLPMGAVGDRVGRRRILQIGLLVFAVGAGAATVAPGPVQVIAARALMGVGAAMVMPATLSLLASSFPAAERPRAIAIWAGFAGAGGAIGPLLSGVLLESFWWGSVFLINLPIIALALGAGLVVLPESADEHHRRLDLVGGALSVVALSALLFGIIEGPERGWADPLTLAGFLVGLVAAAGFGIWERRVAEPMLDLSWFRDRRFTVGSATITLAFFGAFGVFFLATQYFQFVLGFSPLTAAFAQIPIALTLLVVAPRSSDLVDRHDHRRVVSTGLALMSGGVVGLSLLATPDASYWPLLPALVLVGAGLALTTAPSTGLIIQSLPLDRAGVGSAVNDTVREVGAALGVAILGSIVAAGYSSGLDTAGLGPEQAAIAEDSVGAAVQLARSAGLDGLAADARASFAEAFRVAMAVGGAVALLAAGMVLRFGVADREPSG